ncbi:hypothetical protein [Argonema galeatum]|uniref:hypothetical protein n=1 Tax=Argonema galeatum TaxID=2942762 RepID=UPI002011DE3D|nr:hypothetical protein [Argonema galeatum]MCL1466604.1 hypothetical protein [Argonema galeatum A003/A1]
MSTYRKIQIALGTILLWSSTSVSSFAYTNTITPGKFQSDTVKLPVESVPSRQLTLTQDTVLIAGEIRNMMSRIPLVSYTFARFDAIWKNPTDRKKRLFDYCNSQKNFPVKRCFSFIQLWFGDVIENSDFDGYREMDDIIDEIRKM